MSARGETYRATLAARTADGADNTLIVTRQAGRVWLTLLQSMRTAVVLSDAEAAELVTLIVAARGAGR